MTENTNVGAFQFQAYQGLAGLAQISDAWRALAGQCDQPSFFHYPEWYECYLHCLAPTPENVFFCVLRRAGKLVAVAPLECRITRIATIPYRSLFFPQDATHLAAGDFTAARTENPAEVAWALLEGCTRIPELSWDRVCLDLVPETSYCANAFQTLHDRRQVRRFIRYRDQMVLKPFDQMVRGLSENTRKRLRQAQNRLARAGYVRFQTTCGGSDLAATLDVFMDVEASGWKGQAGTAIKCRPQLSAFYRMLAARFSDQGQCDIHTLFVNDQPVAAMFVLRVGEMATFLKAGYDESYAALSPGHSVIAYAMRFYSENTSVRTVDFLSDFDYLHMWQPTRHRVLRVVVFNNGWTGRLAHHATISTYALQTAYGATMGPALRRTNRLLRTTLAGKVKREMLVRLRNSVERPLYNLWRVGMIVPLCFAASYWVIYHIVFGGREINMPSWCVLASGGGMAALSLFPSKKLGLRIKCLCAGLTLLAYSMLFAAAMLIGLFLDVFHFCQAKTQ